MKVLVLISLLFLSASTKIEHYVLNPEKSKVVWSAGNHFGLIEFANGYIELKNDYLVKGRCTIDMTTLKSEDFKNQDIGKLLDDHLKSDHYFHVDKYPQALLDIQESTNINESPVVVTGILTIKNVKRKINFEVVRHEAYFEGEVKVDRVEEFFDSIGKTMAPENIILTVKIHVDLKPK